MVSVIYGITNVPPSPQWKNMLYSYERDTDTLKLEWLLPQAPEIAKVILAHKEGFDTFLVDCIEKYFKGELIGQ